MHRYDLADLHRREGREARLCLAGGTATEQFRGCQNRILQPPCRISSALVGRHLPSHVRLTLPLPRGQVQGHIGHHRQSGPQEAEEVLVDCQERTAFGQVLQPRGGGDPHQSRCRVSQNVSKVRSGHVRDGKAHVQPDGVAH